MNQQEVRLTFRIDIVVRVSVEDVEESAPVFRVLPPMDPPVLGDCDNCGASDNDCRVIMNKTSATKSCCSKCKMTATHPSLDGR